MTSYTPQQTACKARKNHPLESCGPDCVYFDGADLSFENQGSVVLIRPLTADGRAWIEENVSYEPWQWFGDALAVEPRMAAAIANDLEDGYTLRTVQS